MPILLDDAVEPGAYITGANRDERAPARRRAGPRLPVQARRRAHASRPATPSTGTRSAIEPAIEVGNIFKLGTRYSEPLGATYLDESGKSQPIWMGSYGLGPARHRRRGGRAVRRRAGHLVAALDRAVGRRSSSASASEGSEERAVAERLYDELRETGLEVLYDDRDAGPGEKFADAELLGVPAAR